MSRRVITRSVLVLAALSLAAAVAVTVYASDRPAKPADHPAGCCPAGHHVQAAHGDDCSHPQHHAKAAEGKPAATPAAMHRALHKHLANAAEAIDTAGAAVKAGETEQAAAELEKARALVAKALEAVAACGHHDASGAVVNVRCPIMGARIDPDKVAADLRREHQGKVVGFCCAGCPDQWDKLTEEQKQTRLQAAMPKSS